MWKRNLFNKCYWENWITICKTMKLYLYLRSHIKINPKWIKNLEVKPETLILVEENRGRTSSHWQYLFLIC